MSLASFSRYLAYYKIVDFLCPGVTTSAAGHRQYVLWFGFGFLKPHSYTVALLTATAAMFEEPALYFKAEEVGYPEKCCWGCCEGCVPVIKLAVKLRNKLLKGVLKIIQFYRVNKYYSWNVTNRCRDQTKKKNWCFTAVNLEGWNINMLLWQMTQLKILKHRSGFLTCYNFYYYY